LKYQREHELVQDGIAGPKTMEKMGITRNSNISSAPKNRNTQKR
jgi:murein L,D-transpeptidase YcbB/YkuD